jgi:hypothetical protein
MKRLAVNISSVSDRFNYNGINAHRVDGSIVTDTQLVQILKLVVQTFRYNVRKVLSEPVSLFDNSLRNYVVGRVKVLQCSLAPLNGGHTFWRLLSAQPIFAFYPNAYEARLRSACRASARCRGRRRIRVFFARSCYQVPSFVFPSWSYSGSISNRLFLSI